jgi:hypothetical protein
MPAWSADGGSVATPHPPEHNATDDAYVQPFGLDLESVKPIFRAGAVVICLAFLLGACGPPAPDYTLDELVETLVDGGFCAELELRGSGVDDPGATTVPHAYCGNEHIRGGLLAATFSSTDDRLFGILNLLAPGCDSWGEEVPYVFGDKWVVLTNSVLRESDMPEAMEEFFGISKQVGSQSVNIIICQVFHEKLGSVDPSEWDAELLHEAFEE